MQLHRTVPEQRAEIYGDVRELLTFGMLAHPVAVNGARFVLRTLNDVDWRMLVLRAHGLSGRGHQAWTIAASLWMVDGLVIRGDEELLYEVHEMVDGLPRVVVDDLYGIVHALMRKLTSAWQVLEAFLYEDESRELWRREGKFLQAKSAMGGEFASRNPLLKEWVRFNEHEDEMDLLSHDWDIAKFIASPHAPKAIKKITAQDSKKQADLQRRRERVLDRTYYEVKGQLRRDVDKPKMVPRRLQEFRVAETEEELHDEMNRWVAGIKDEHDEVVDGVKNRIRAEVEGKKAADEARRASFARAMEEEGIVPSTITPLAGEAGKAFIERMKTRMPGTSQVYNDNRHNSAYEKYIKNDPSVGSLRSDGQQVVTAGPTDPSLLELLTRPDESGDLQRDVESRRPIATFVDDGEED